MLAEIDPAAPLKVKGVERPLADLDPAQLASLDAADITAVTAGLTPHRDAVEALGYRLR